MEEKPLSAKNAELMKRNPIEQIRQTMQYAYTPSESKLADMIPLLIEQLVYAEEYPFDMPSQAEQVKRAEEYLQQYLDAIKESIICSIKCRRGEWVASA